MTEQISSAVRLNNLGITCHNEGKFLESDVAHKQCLAILESGGSQTVRQAAQSLFNRAALYRTFHEYHEAERLYQIAARTWDRHGWPHEDEIAKSDMFWADVFEKDGMLGLFAREVRQLRESADGSVQQVLRKLGPWYHDVELTPQISTNSSNRQYMQNRWSALQPFVPADLSGKSVLDIGCNAGFFSLEMKKRNAARVLGIDIMPHCLAQARFLSHWFEQPVDLRELEVYDVESLGKFDLVVFIGVLYHLKHPLYALEKVAAVCKDTMYLQSLLRGDETDFEPAANYPFGEQAAFSRPEFPRMYFIEKSFNDDDSNWWVPNRSCLKAMARAAGFRTVEDSGNPELIICRK